MNIDPKTRQKIAAVLALLLVPLMLWLFNTNLKKVKSIRRASPAAGVAALSLPPPPPAPPVTGANKPEIIDPAVEQEQRRIAALLPKRNPFQTGNRVESAGQPAKIYVPSGVAALRITGVMRQPGTGRRMAFINGRLLAEGGTIDD